MVTLEGVTRFRQVWFAGNHSDVGGSYPENKSRLSDIALKWMVDFIAKEIPDETARIAINEDVLHLKPSYDGMMHDELMVGHGPAHKIHFWPAGERKVDPSRGIARDSDKSTRISECTQLRWIRPVSTKISCGPPQSKAVLSRPSIYRKYDNIRLGRRD